MRQWIQGSITWVLDLICGPGWTGGVEGAVPFAVVCGIIVIATFIMLSGKHLASPTLRDLQNEEYNNFVWSGLFLSTLLFIVLFATLYYSRSKAWIFVFALITGASPHDFCPTAYNYAEWPLRMKILLWAAVIIGALSLFSSSREKKPLRVILEHFIFSSTCLIIMALCFYIRELSDANGKSLGFDALFFIPELIFWMILIPLPVWTVMGSTYDDKKDKPTPANTGFAGASASQSSKVLPTGTMIRDVTSNCSCRIRREGDFVYICHPDGTEDVVYASEFDGKETITTSRAHYILP